MHKRFIVLTLFLLLGFIGSAALGDLNTGLVAHWQFEGNFQDSAGTNHATAKGDAQNRHRPPAGPGRRVRWDR